MRMLKHGTNNFERETSCLPNALWKTNLDIQELLNDEKNNALYPLGTEDALFSILAALPFLCADTA